MGQVSVKIPRLKGQFSVALNNYTSKSVLTAPLALQNTRISHSAAP